MGSEVSKVVNSNQQRMDFDEVESELELGEDLKALFLSGLYSDATIRVKDREFKVHRSILSARSPVFRSIINQNMAVNSVLLNIDDCDPDNFHDFLLYIYSGRIDHITPDNASGLYKIAHKYDMIELKNGCALCMAKKLSVSLFCDAIVIASVYEESELLDAATKFFNENFTDILPSSKWLKLLSEQPMLIKQLLNGMGKDIENRSKMQIFIRLLTDTTMMLEVEPSDTILSLKVKIGDYQDISVDDQRLLFRGNELDNGKTLSDYNIESESSLDLLLEI